MTSKEMNKFIYWATTTQASLLRLSQMAKEHPELENSRMLEFVCRGTVLMLSNAIQEVLR